MNSVISKVAISILCVAGLSAPALAEYPTKPIRLIAGFSAGGGTDTTARGFASYLHESESMNGMPAFIVNIPGASGQRGANEVLDSEADGYTLYIINIGTLIGAELAKGADAPFNASTDFINVGCMTQLFTSLQVHASNPATNAKEWVDQVRASGETIKWATSGPTSMHALVGKLFLDSVGIPHQAVPFSGGTAIRGAVISQSVDAAFNGVHLTAGFESEVRNIGIPALVRDPSNPDVPTFEEQGLPAIGITAPMCLFAPKGTPKEATDALEAAVADVTALEGFARFMSQNNLSAAHIDRPTAEVAMQQMYEVMGPVVEEVIKGQ